MFGKTALASSCDDFITNLLLSLISWQKNCKNWSAFGEVIGNNISAPFMLAVAN